ncbi:MAG: hypothetical protein QOF88_2655, partial [Mycobacterium sp.]|nr:hypothetical protein [Mycobacterium sp.]
MHGVAVVQLRAAVTDRVVDGRWAQQVGMAAGLVERDRERLAHVRHHREVQQPGDIHLVVQPARIDPVVVREQLGQFPTGGGLVDLAA